MKEFISTKCKSILIILSIAGLLASCKEYIDLELNDQKYSRIVVEGRLTNQMSNHLIKITKTISYSKNEVPPTVSNAEVLLTEEGSGIQYVLTEIDSMPGYYSTEMIEGKPFETYKLSIKSEGESYEATSFLDTVPQMDSINYEYNLDDYFGYQRGYYTIRMSAFEPDPKGNIYMFKIYMNDTLLNPWLDNIPYQDDEIMNDKYLANVEIYYIEQERVTQDTNTIRVEMLSISRDEWRFNNAFIAETVYGGSIFNGPPANIPSNILNTGDGLDGVGFFSTSSVSTLTMPFFREHADSTNREDYIPRPR